MASELTGLEETLKQKFIDIFGVKKCSFDAPGEIREQECLFIEIEVSNYRIKDGREKARVVGNAYMHGTNDKLKFGYFAKAIKRASDADYNLTKDLFFFDIEKNTVRYRNLVQRGFSFEYFFDSQHDPAVGTITSVVIDVEEQ